MTTLAVDKPRAFQLGEMNDIPMIADDIIYEGAAVGVVDASGHARPLTTADRFAGFAKAKADNAGGAAAAINVHVQETGKVQLPVTGAVITDKGQPVYASDDDTFSFNPADGVFIGFFDRYVSAGVGIVKFDVDGYRDPWAAYTKRETIAATKTLDAEDTGKLFCVTEAADADQITIPAVATGVADVVFLAVGAFGSTAMLFDTDANDGILTSDIAAGDGKTLTLTKATQRRGDFLHLVGAEADGYLAKYRGIFVRET